MDAVQKRKRITYLFEEIDGKIKSKSKKNSQKNNSHQSHSHDYENYKVISFSKTGKTKIFDKISP